MQTDMWCRNIFGHFGKQGRRERKGNFLNHHNKFTIGAVIVFIIVLIVTLAFQCQLLDAILMKADSVVQDLGFEEKDVELVLVGLGEEEFVGDTRIGLFDGNIWHGNGLRSIGKFLDGGVIGRGRGFGRCGS